MDWNNPIYLFDLLPNSDLWSRQIKQCRPILLGSSDLSFEQGNIDGTGYFSHCDIKHGNAIVGRSQNHRL